MPALPGPTLVIRQELQKGAKTATQGPFIIGRDLEGSWTLHLVSERVVVVMVAPVQGAMGKQSPSGAVKYPWVSEKVVI